MERKPERDVQVVARDGSDLDEDVHTARVDHSTGASKRNKLKGWG